MIMNSHEKEKIEKRKQNKPTKTQKDLFFYYYLYKS